MYLRKKLFLFLLFPAVVNAAVVDFTIAPQKPWRTIEERTCSVEFSGKGPHPYLWLRPKTLKPDTCYRLSFEAERGALPFAALIREKIGTEWKHRGYADFFISISSGRNTVTEIIWSASSVFRWNRTGRSSPSAIRFRKRSTVIRRFRKRCCGCSFICRKAIGTPSSGWTIWNTLLSNSSGRSSACANFAKRSFSPQKNLEKNIFSKYILHRIFFPKKTTQKRSIPDYAGI